MILQTQFVVLCALLRILSYVSVVCTFRMLARIPDKLNKIETFSSFDVKRPFYIRNHLPLYQCTWFSFLLTSWNKTIGGFILKTMVA